MAHWEEMTVDGNPVKIFAGMPPKDTRGDGPHPAFMICQHAPGLDAFVERVIDRLAEAGYASFAWDAYHRTGADHPERREKVTDDGLITDMKATLAHMAKNPKIDMRRVGIMGHCMGGRTAYLGAASIDAFKVCGVFWGGSILMPRGHSGPSPLDLTRNIKCPVIGFFGNEDANPSPVDVNKIDAELTRCGVPHDFHRYDGAGHAFQNFTNAKNYREAQAEDAWGKELAFFKTKLNP
jgi:carboxymethylenebutenolidase